MKLIWATRGRTWGFRFLMDGGLGDPLPEYSRVFEGLDQMPELLHHVGNMTALRFEDPFRRQDRAGRIIPHDFVLFDGVPVVDSVSAGRDLVWPMVEDQYERLYDGT
ncbi:hypothetical protein [Microbacterium sp. 179-I 3D4 NHS]|uniref:hypothetical protein n=1 Tax=Microbacterium sp. 179-I 3D4 NHS TaxID=3142381 RepID=UPI0039A3AA81